MLRTLFVIAIVMLPGLSLAEGFKHREKSPDAPPLPVIEDYCTDGQGQRKELGEVICITASCQTWLAKCDMSLNNTMWRKIQDGCPGVAVTPSLLQRLQGLQPRLYSLAIDAAIAAPETQTRNNG